MKQSKANPRVDFFFAKAEKWREELEKLRAILLDSPIVEELKWGHPCYTFEGGNVVIIQGFKEYCALLFPKGALLKDADRILIRQTENVQAARQIRFTDARQILKMKATLKAYIDEAIQVEKSGAKITYKKTADFKMPEEFKSKLDKTPALKTAFEALTPGRQRAYLLHFAAPKQSETRESRIKKCIPQILTGKGLNDQYLSKKTKSH